MVKAIKYEFVVMINKRTFWIAFCATLLFSVVSFSYTAFGQWGIDASLLLSANSLYAGNAYSSTWYYFTYLFSFIIVLPHAMSYISDLETGVFASAILRTRPSYYYCSKMVVTFLGNVLVIAVPLLINLLLCHIAFSSQPNYLFGAYGTANYDGTILGTNFVFQTNQTAIPFVSLFLEHPTLYNLLYIIFLSFASGVLGVFILCFSFVVTRQRAFLFLPVYLYILATSVITEYIYSKSISNHGVSYINLNLMDYFAPFGYVGRSTAYLAILFCLLVLFCSYATVKVIRSDELITQRMS